MEGGPAGGESVQWTLYFKEGGVGTIIPLFFRCCAYVRSFASSLQAASAAAADAQGYPPPATAAAAAAAGGGSSAPQQFLQTALVDPSGARRPGQGPGVRLRSVRLLPACLPAAMLCCDVPCSSVLLQTSTVPDDSLFKPPADPTKVYLTQPLDDSQQRADAPKFPAPLV